MSALKPTKETGWFGALVDRLAGEYPELKDQMALVCERMTSLLLDRVSKEADASLMAGVGERQFEIESPEASIGFPTFVERALHSIASKSAVATLSTEEIHQLAEGFTQSYFRWLARTLDRKSLDLVLRDLPAEIRNRILPESGVERQT